MGDEDQDRGSQRRTYWLLAVGAALGIGLAVASMLGIGDDAEVLSDTEVARVNGVPIRAADYLRAVTALASDRRSPLSDADRRHVLNRLVDEELLVQYGLDLGLARVDRRVRADLVSAVLAAQVASVDGSEAPAQEVRRFYDENIDFFMTPGRLRLAVLWIRSGRQRDAEEAMQRAAEAAAALRAGDSFESVEARYGDEQVAPLPDAYLPPAKVREYVGPSVSRIAMELEAGEVSDPIVSGGGVYVLVVRDKEPPSAPSLADIEDQVRAEVKRRAGDQAVRDTLEQLRLAGNVVEREALP